MKQVFLLVLALPTMLSAQTKLTVSGTLTGLQAGTHVIMVDANQPTDTIAKGLAKTGSFSISGEMKEPGIVNINFGEGKDIRTFLHNGNIKIVGDLAKLDKAKLTGSKLVQDFGDFRKVFEPAFESLGKVTQEIQSKGQTDSLMKKYEKSKAAIQKKVDQFINGHLASPVSPFLMVVVMQITDDVAVTEKRLGLIKPAALENKFGIYLKETVAITKVTAIGSVAQDFTQADTSGTPVSLSSFRGKYVLLDFWASWCGPCRQENPNVVANYNKFNAKNFTVLGVSLDREGQKQKWLDAIHKDNLTWTHVSDLQFWSNAVAQAYKVDAIPQNFLIGPDGKIVAKNLRGPALEAKLCELLGCN